MTHYHLIGIGGSGLSAIARVLLERGHQVSGSDLMLSPMAKNLQESGAEVVIGHKAENVMGADLIIRSSAVPDDNPEVLAGLNAHIPVVKRADFLKQLTADKKVIAVAGTHGKTTTTAMCAWLFYQSGNDPSYIIGGVSKNLKSNAHAGEGEIFIIEADEYDRMFMGLSPDMLVLTIIEHDHPDYFAEEEDYFKAFIDFTKLVKPGGTIIACSDDPGVQKVISDIPANIKTITYGTQGSPDYFVSNIRHAAECGVSFTLTYPKDNSEKKRTNEIQLLVPGKHNALNAAAALAVANFEGLPIEDSVSSIEKYAGTGRRFDTLGTVSGITIVDDYAHHPTEIKATLSAARCRFPDREIWTVWQPHTYSRTRELINEFKDAFSQSDHVVVTEIYPSREKKQDYSSGEVVKRMIHPDVKMISELDDARDYLMENMQPGAVLIVLSAGDADRISREILENLNQEGKTTP